ncbi:MAG: bifunctional diguanylate cyclase/phosphodiesterase, partial [Gammaproteobacteria bacterium]|nr:bifunctional diguanylate cyclase/phosphodiesterase [Gammaproteobacteria bacterium]
MQSPGHSALIRTLIYVIFGVVWIIYSDRFLENIVDDVQTLTQLQTYKGWSYVGITAVLLYFLLYQGFKKERSLSARDELTQLLNRHMFRQELESELEFAEEHHQTVALIAFNIDEFRRINHACGQQSADSLLQRTANALRDHFADYPTLIARLGGDEFAVAMLHTRNTELAVTKAREFQHLFKQIQLDNYQFELSISAGIAMFPNDAEEVKDLVACATLAQEEAKNLGPGQLRLYDHFFGESIHSRMQLTTDLRYALDRGELSVVYQPQFSTHTLKLTGVEALLRWQHPQHGAIRPDTFINLAEQQGFIRQVTDYVFEKSIRELTELELLGVSVPRLAINVSALDFAEDNSIELFYQRLENLHDWSLLQLELTETAVINNFESTLRTLKVLRDANVNLSIDDFGTGYSSLNILRRLPIHEVKIDRSFIRDLQVDDDDRTIVRTILAMAHSLNLRVVGEGVEQIEQLSFLEEHGCHDVQGYLLA